MGNRDSASAGIGSRTAFVSAAGNSPWSSRSPRGLRVSGVLACRLPVAVLVSIVLASGAAGVSAQSLPSGWATTEIGAADGGGVDAGGDVFTVSGGGADIWDISDGFRFVFRPLTGDGVVTAQVASLHAVHEWTKAGVMIRETLAPGSTHASMVVTGANGLAFQRRVTPDGASTHTAGPASHAPAWVRLSRTGTTFTGSVSADVISWTTVGSEQISMASTVYVGLAVTSHATGQLATATFTDVSGSSAPPPSSVESRTLVFFRHGEKPEGGYGQITCQGLQRALALRHVLTNRFGTPQFIFAPNPLPKVGDPAGSFSYVRPLATVEPTAIAAGLPVNAEYGFSDVNGIRQALLAPELGGAMIFVAWEHARLVDIVQSVMDTFNSGVTVPAWTYADYDSLYIVRLTRNDAVTTAQFDREYQGLNGMPLGCP